MKRKFQTLISDQKFSEILIGSAWALSGRVLATGAAMITSIIIARFYGAKVMGIVAMLNSFLTIVTILTVLGTNTSILRLIPEHTAKYSISSAFNIYRKAQYLVAGFSLFVGAVLFVGSDWVAERVFAKPDLSFFFAMASLFVIVRSLMELNTQAVRGLGLIRIFALMQVLPSFSKLLILTLVTFCLFHQNNPVYALFASWLITALVGVGVMNFVFRKKMTSNDAMVPMALKRILCISLPMLTSATMTFIIGQTGVIMLGIFRTEAEVGYYFAAVRLATLTSFVISSINSIAAPKFSELFHSGRLGELFDVAKKSTKLIFWATAPILLILLVLGKPTLWLLFGHDFAIAYPALAFLAIGHFVHSVSGSTANFLNMTGNQGVLTKSKIVSALLNVGLNLFLIPYFGMYGAAFAAMASISYWNVYSLIYIKVKYGRNIGYLPAITS